MIYEWKIAKGFRAADLFLRVYVPRYLEEYKDVTLYLTSVGDLVLVKWNGDGVELPILSFHKADIMKEFIRPRLTFRRRMIETVLSDV